MLSDGARRWLQDIRHNIYLVNEWIAGVTADQFVQDTMRFYAVVRALEIISEASRRIDPETRARYGDLQWNAIAGAGNIYRHNYDLVEERYVWRTATEELPKLLAAVESELTR